MQVASIPHSAAARRCAGARLAIEIAPGRPCRPRSSAPPAACAD